MAALLLLFGDATLGPGGNHSGDASFMAAHVVKGYWYGSPVDFNYQGLASFYPPLFPLLVGRFAALWNVDPQLARQLGCVVLPSVLVPVGYLLWTPHIGRRPALVLMLFTILCHLADDLWKPYEMFSTVVFPPLWLQMLSVRTRQWSWRTIGTGALAGAVMATFYYPFFIAGTDLVRRALFRDARLNRQQWQRLASTAAIGALLSAWYWAPLLADVASHPFHSQQNRWFLPDHVAYGRLSGNFNPFPVLGVAALVLEYPKGRAMAGLRGLGVSAVVFIVLANLMAWAGMPILAQRAWPVLSICLDAAGLVAADRLLARLAFPRRTARLSFLMTLAFASSAYVLAALPKGKVLRDAHQQEATGDLVTALQVERFKHKTVLTTAPGLHQLTPLFGFVAPSAHQSHPSAQFDARVAYLQSLSHLRGDALCQGLRRTPFGPIDYLYLADKAFVITADNFPYKTKSIKVPVPNVAGAGCLTAVTGISDARFMAVH